MKHTQNQVSPSLLEASALEAIRSDYWPSAQEVRKLVRGITRKVPKPTTMVMVLMRLEERGFVERVRLVKYGKTRYRYCITRAGRAELRKIKTVMRRLAA